MNLEYIKLIINQINNSGIKTFEYIDDEISIKIIKSDDTFKINKSSNITNNELACTVHEKVKIKSSYVGKVIFLDNRTNKPFVLLGQSIKKGDLLCIIHYLNVPMHIISPCNGILINIFVKNNSFVEYGTLLFEIN